MTNSANIDLKLRQVVDNIEHLEDDEKEIKEQIAATYKEATMQGFDAKTIRKIVSIRKKDVNKVREEEDLLEMYKKALGMI
ncbi:MAG: DUF2312 domain-containing protein [Rickettsiales bacterium]|jgi:uncharacterized protein (UPF0335 family)|nr:DUF2312 domain-containing protein [Rickettsiales bacterium]